MTLLALALGGLVSVVLLGLIGRFVESWWTPAHAFSLAWAGSLFASQYAMGGALAPSIFALAVLIAAWWCFLLGSLAVLRFLSPKTIVRAPQRDLRPNAAPALLIGLVALQVLAVYVEARQGGIVFPTSVDELAAMRISGELRGVDPLPFLLGIFRWGHVLYLPLGFALYKERRSHLWWALPMVAALFLGSLKFTRAPLVQVVVVTLWCWHTILRPSSRRRLAAIALSGALVVAVFVLGQARLVEADVNISYDTTEGLWSYVAASPKAFEELLNEPGLFGEPGPYSLDFLYVPLQKLSLIESHASLIRPFVAVPIRTNLFTFLDAYTADAGVPGALLGALLTGGIAAAIYSHAMRTRRVGSIIAGAYVMYCSLMAPANNEFIRAALPIYLFLAWVVDRIATSRGGQVPALISPLGPPSGGQGPSS